LKAQTSGSPAADHYKSRPERPGAQCHEHNTRADIYRSQYQTGHAHITPNVPFSFVEGAEGDRYIGIGSTPGYWGRFMSRRFDLVVCPTCKALYQVVKVEAGETTDRDCRVCGGPLAGREGRFVLKYFFLREDIRRKRGGAKAT
jgi:ssDNA-binding Zn-finger/Zn-ribbon topoisomerase 1